MAPKPKPKSKTLQLQRMKIRESRFYILLLLFAMVALLLAKRAAFLIRRGPFMPLGTVSQARTFIFSSSGRDRAKKGDSESSGNGGSESDSSTSSGIPAAPSSAGQNYDKSSFEKNLFYNVAVAFQPKNRMESNIFRQKKTKTAAQLLPSGEDNLFVTNLDKDGYLALGVADGVGGWSEAGYDSLAISRELCSIMKSLFEASEDKSSLTPQQLLEDAFAKVLVSPKVEIGGTTACLGIFTPEKKLHVANLGDSWCGVFRNHKLIKETEFQTHNFNTPYQLAKIPKQILRQAELQGKRYIIDSPGMCDLYVWNLQKDDVVIFATDGVTDNVIPQDIEIFLKDQSTKPLEDVSAMFVQEVVKVSKDPNFPSAFAQELSRLTGQRYLGGKEDDITVVIVKVL